MKIYIHEADEEKDIRLNIPNGLIFNRLGTMIAGKMIKNRAAETGITEKQMKRMRLSSLDTLNLSILKQVKGKSLKLFYKRSNSLKKNRNHII